MSDRSDKPLNPERIEAPVSGCKSSEPSTAREDGMRRNGSLTSNLRSALAEWDRLSYPRDVMRAEGITFGDVLTLRGNAIERLIEAVRQALSGDSSEDDENLLKEAAEFISWVAACRIAGKPQRSRANQWMYRYNTRPRAPSSIDGAIPACEVEIPEPGIRARLAQLANSANPEISNQWATMPPENGTTELT